MRKKELPKKFVSILFCFVFIFSIISLSQNTTLKVQAVSKRTKVLNKLKKKTWYLSKMYLNGERIGPGSAVVQYGAYIKFKKNKKFYCNVGLNYK